MNNNDFDFKKIIIDNNKIDTSIEELEDLIKKMRKLKNRRSTNQLADKRKITDGFSVEDSVIDIGEQEYGFSDGEDILYTYGIDNCCGVVAYDKEKKFLCHLDGSNNYSEVIELIESNKFDIEGTTVIIAPGGNCGLMEGCFDYNTLQKTLIDKGFKVMIQRIPATYGFISVDTEKVTIGTGLDRSLDFTTTIKEEKVK